MDESGWRVVSGDLPLRILGDCSVKSMMAPVRYWHNICPCTPNVRLWPKVDVGSFF